jgi:hypothetical protein
MNITEIRKAVKAEAQALYPDVKFSCRQERSSTEYILNLVFECGKGGELDFDRRALYALAREFESKVSWDISIDVFSVKAF